MSEWFLIVYIAWGGGSARYESWVMPDQATCEQQVEKLRINETTGADNEWVVVAFCANTPDSS